MTTTPITPWSGRDATPTALQPIVDAPVHPMQALQPLIDGAPFASSPTVGAIAGALAQAQAVIRNAEKSKTAIVKMRGGGEFRYSYADLGDVLDAVREPLGANGIAVVQIPLMKDRTVTVVTLLLHASGEWIGSRLSAPADDDGRMTPVQAIGTIISYLRRYALTAMTGAASEDNDGASNGGSNNAPRALDTVAGRAIRAKADAAMGRLSPDQAAAVNAAIASASNISELRRVEKKLDATLAALDAPSPGAAEPSTDTTDDGWLDAVAQKIGEDADGNPRFGAMISGAAAAEVPVGTRLKVAMRNRSGKMRAVVTEIIEQMPLGVLVGTRKATDEEAKA